MPSMNQLQNRLLIKKNCLTKVNLNIANAVKSKNNIVLRKLNQEKGALDQDIRKLERQLTVEKNAFKEKKALNPYHNNMKIVHET